MSVGGIESVRVCGHQTSVDSFAACLQAALDYWGRDVPYDCIAGLSGAAFSPAYDPGQKCAAWWMEAGGDIRVSFLGHALGFTVQRAVLGDGPGQVPQPLMAAHARESLARGGVVLCRTDPIWSLATCWDDDRFCLAGPEGSHDVIRVPGEMTVYFLEPAPRSLTSCEVLRAAIGFGTFVTTCSCDRAEARFGGRLYDAWSERMREDAFCPACGDEEWRCAARTVSRCRGTHLAAVRFLNRGYSFLKDCRAADSLRDAACTYAAMASVLAPHTAERLQQQWQDAPARQDLARAVERVRQMHGHVASQLQSADQALSSPS